MKKTPDWLFIGAYPNATIYADKRKEKRGEYHNIAHVYYDELRLQINDKDKKYAEVIKRATQEFNERAGDFSTSEIWERTSNEEQSPILKYKNYIAHRLPSSHTQGSLRIYKDGKLLQTYSLEASPYPNNDNRANPYFMTDGEVRALIDRNVIGLLPTNKMSKGGIISSTLNWLNKPI